jgi:hypothetical protein
MSILEDVGTPLCSFLEMAWGHIRLSVYEDTDLYAHRPAFKNTFLYMSKLEYLGTTVSSFLETAWRRM